MKKYHLFTLFLMSWCLCTYAQMPPTLPLSDGDVDKFIKTYYPLKQDLESLGEEFEEAKDYEGMQAIMANEKVKSVLRKHGWDGQWMGKLMTITYAYGMVKMEKEMAALSDEERKEMEQFQGPYLSQIKSMIQDSDLEQVQKRFDELDKIFIEEEEDEDY